MGGYNSGRQGWRRRVEHHRSLDVNRLRKAGALDPGAYTGWAWQRDGETVASIGLRGESGRLRLVYRVGRDGEEKEDIDYPVRLLSVPCRFGGERFYFQCPGMVRGRFCGRRVAKLYLGWRYFVCRHCLGLAYASQAEAPHERARRRADKLRLSMDGETGCDAPWPKRPKGMWRRTYERKIAEIDRREEIADAVFTEGFIRRFGKYGDLVDLLR